MKKNVIILVSAFAIVVFQSCTGNSKVDQGMQKPVAANASTEMEKGESESGEQATAEGATTDANALNYQNLQDAFKGETTASAKYAAYSKKAEAEGSVNCRF